MRDSTASRTYQFVTIAGDGQLCAWDTRYKEKLAKKAAAGGAAVAGGKGGSSKQVDEVKWTPAFRCNLMKGASELGLCRFDLNMEVLLQLLAPRLSEPHS